MLKGAGEYAYDGTGGDKTAAGLLTTAAKADIC